MMQLGISGTAATVRDRCRWLVARGANHLSFGPPLGPDPVAAVAALGRDVVGPLRAEQQKEASLP
jgi:5,10-methylenetetrahydromethanopterin reductase